MSWVAAALTFLKVKTMAFGKIPGHVVVNLTPNGDFCGYGQVLGSFPSCSE